MTRRWIDDHIRRRGTLYRIATDNRVYAVIIALAIVSGVLSGVYG